MAIVEMTIDSVRQDLLNYEWVVMLKEKAVDRYLPIYVGALQGEFIKSLLVGTEITEPVDFDFSVPDVDINIAELQSVIINRFRNNIFHAQLLFTHQTQSYKIDCQPAKAIALAIESRVPIFVEETVLRKAAVEVQA